MATSLYDAEYLNRTSEALTSFKKESYRPFQELPTGMVADVGCGTGFDVLALSQLLGANVEVVGIDHDAGMIETAANSIPADNRKVRFITGNACSLDFQDGTVQGLRSERMLQHLADPGIAVGEFYRVLQPEAPVVIAETDWTSISFYNGDDGVQQRVKHYMANQHVACGRVASQLSRYLHQAEFRHLTLQLFPFWSRSWTETKMLLKVDTVLDKMCRDGRLATDEKVAFIQAQELAETAGHYACAIHMVIAAAKK